MSGGDLHENQCARTPRAELQLVAPPSPSDVPLMQLPARLSCDRRNQVLDQASRASIALRPPLSPIGNLPSLSPH